MTLVGISLSPLTAPAKLLCAALIAIPLIRLILRDGLGRLASSVSAVQYLYHQRQHQLLWASRNGLHRQARLHPDSRVWGTWVILITRRPARVFVLHPGNTDIDALRRLRVALLHQKGE